MRRTQCDGFLGFVNEHIAQKYDRLPPGLLVLARNPVSFSRDNISPGLDGIFVRGTNDYD
jgi:hypothetical protein